jgi:hypothetical protein
MSQQVHFVKDVLNGVEIDRPINHDLSTYLKGVGYNGQPMSKYDHAGTAIQSVKFKGMDEYDEQPNFTVRFKVEFDSVQEIAGDFWRFESAAKIVEILEDGIIVEVEEAIPACSVDRTQNVVMNDTHAGYEYPVDCAFLKQAALDAGGFDKISDATHAEIEDMEHWCTGNIYEVAVAVVPVGADTATNVGEMAAELFGEDGDVDTKLFSMTDEEVRAELWDAPDILETITASDGKQYRVISNMHED